MNILQKKPRMISPIVSPTSQLTTISFHWRNLPGENFCSKLHKLIHCKFHQKSFTLETTFLLLAFKRDA